MTNALWQLAGHCWMADPTGRPTANAICDDIFHQLRESEFNMKLRVIEHRSSPTLSRRNTSTTSDNRFDANSTSGIVSTD
jgi:hypothetical protein